ncbi:hypothetical protein GDO86_008860 [Hymenochirus boettgeri]|uniref:CCDC113/CCDC96 coiled-coil domain-containing protein n=1 Tax=Hymenochirus boettgeri TaxID=247094 RepID=A0A8T2J3F0_9PIPI|nr:hypothetical protein GDO86_008860 [Hymenochirus boettgeri]
MNDVTIKEAVSLASEEEPADLIVEESTSLLHSERTVSSASIHGKEYTIEDEKMSTEEMVLTDEEVDRTELESAKQHSEENEIKLPMAEGAEPSTEEEDMKLKEEELQLYQALTQERDKVQQHNAQLQNKLYEYFRRKKGEDIRPETEKRISDQEQRYHKYLSSLEEIRKNNILNASQHRQQIEELTTQCQEVVSRVEKEWNSFQAHKKSIALLAYKRLDAGKHASSAFIEEVSKLQTKEDHKDKEVMQVRLENIKFKNQFQRFDSTLRSKEELGDGLHLIDFEQLKIENQTYNEKIEERNEELLKLRKKITNTVHILTHLKEKLQFVLAENQEKKDQLMETEALVANKRDILTKTKQARDSSRRDNLKLKQKCGLLDNKLLLKDLEDKVDSTEEMCLKLERLKRRHAEVTLSSKGLLKKIEDAKTTLQD